MTSLISILLLYKYSSYDYRVIFFMSKCVYFFWGHSVCNSGVTSVGFEQETHEFSFMLCGTPKHVEET